MYNNQDDSSGDEDEGGFQTRRLEVEVWGQVADPRITYLLKLIHSRSTGNTSMEGWELGYDGESQSVILGGAYYFELGDGNNSAIDADRAGSDYHSWTVDLSYENQGINLYGAYIGANIDPDETTAAQRDMTGLVIQSGVDVVPDKLELFARWEYIDGDVAGEDEFDAWATGFNYYISGHRVKFSADVVYLNKDLPTANPFGENPASRGLGLISGTEDEMAVRTQMQLLF